MKPQFQKHYTREEARALLPQLRRWFETLERLQTLVRQGDERIASMMEPGCDVGGDTVNRWVTAMTEMREVLREFREREILVKDIERGLVDFPALMGGKEVFLCWEKDEDDIEFWHDLDSGYAGREKL